MPKLVKPPTRVDVIQQVLGVDNHGKRWTNQEVELLIDEIIKLKTKEVPGKDQQNYYRDIVLELISVLDHGNPKGKAIRNLLIHFFPTLLARIEHPPAGVLSDGC